MSRTDKMRGRLASIQKDREDFERQRKELEADMNEGRDNINKINKGLKKNEIIKVSSTNNNNTTTSSSSSTSATNTTSGSGSTNNSYRNSGRKKDTNSGNDSNHQHHHPINHMTSSNIGGGGISSGVAGEEDFTHNPNHHPTNPNEDLSRSFFPNTISMVQHTIMPSGPRISEWCYHAPIDSLPPTVKSRDLYESIRLLGRGSFGEVNLVKNSEDNKLFAIKTQLVPKDSEYQNVIQEVKLLRLCRHPCIIDIHDAFLLTNPRIVCIVMSYCEAGNISTVIASNKKNKTSISENQIIKWTLQLGLALQFLHDNHIIHRDLKPMNVLLTEGGDNLKLADFGLAVSLNTMSVSDMSVTDEAGTPYYTAPEIIQREVYAYPVDCWAFGVVLHQILSLDRPFGGHNTSELVKAILTTDPPPLPSHYSEDIKLICKELLHKNQCERLTMTELLLEPIIFSKLHGFASSYRPRTLEERIRRTHVKYVELQVDSISKAKKGFSSVAVVASNNSSSSQKKDPIRSIVEKIQHRMTTLNNTTTADMKLLDEQYTLTGIEQQHKKEEEEEEEVTEKGVDDHNSDVMTTTTNKTIEQNGSNNNDSIIKFDDITNMNNNKPMIFALKSDDIIDNDIPIIDNIQEETAHNNKNKQIIIVPKRANSMSEIETIGDINILSLDTTVNTSLLTSRTQISSSRQYNSNNTNNSNNYINNNSPLHTHTSPTLNLETIDYTENDTPRSSIEILAHNDYGDTPTKNPKEIIIEGTSDIDIINNEIESTLECIDISEEQRNLVIVVDSLNTSVNNNELSLSSVISTISPVLGGRKGIEIALAKEHDLLYTDSQNS